jgi:hypothetical protein
VRSRREFFCGVESIHNLCWNSLILFSRLLFGSRRSGNSNNSNSSNSRLVLSLFIHSFSCCDYTLLVGPTHSNLTHTLFHTTPHPHPSSPSPRILFVLSQLSLCEDFFRGCLALQRAQQQQQRRPRRQPQPLRSFSRGRRWGVVKNTSCWFMKRRQTGCN